MGDILNVKNHIGYTLNEDHGCLTFGVIVEGSGFGVTLGGE